MSQRPEDAPADRVEPSLTVRAALRLTVHGATGCSGIQHPLLEFLHSVLEPGSQADRLPA